MYRNNRLAVFIRVFILIVYDVVWMLKRRLNDLANLLNLVGRLENAKFKMSDETFMEV